MADEPRAATGGTYAAAIVTVRETSKWVLASLAAVGGVLIAGLSLTSLREIDDRLALVAAVAAVLVALAGVAWAIAQTAAVLQPSTVTLDDLVAAERDGRRDGWRGAALDRKSGLLHEFASYGELRDAYAQAPAEMAGALAVHQADPGDATKAATAQIAQDNAVHVAAIARYAVEMAAYFEIRARLKVWKQLLAGTVVALGVGAFAVLVAWPRDAPTRPDFHGAQLRDTDLSGASLVGASFAGMALDGVDFEGADLRDADFKGARLAGVDLLGAKTAGADFSGATWEDVVCPDGTASQNAGDRCDAHLTPLTR